MENFTKSQLIKSIAMPVITFLYGFSEFLGEIFSFWAEPITVFDVVRASFFLLVILAGGVVPVLLTVFRNIHTERYFFKRLITFGVCLAAIWFVGHIPYGIFAHIYYFVIVGCKVVYELHKVQDEDTTNGERAVMFLSDYVIMYGIHNCLVMFRDLGTMGFLR